MEHTKEHNTHKHEEKEEKTESGSEYSAKLSGDDIVAFFRKVFKAGNSRSIVWKNENGKEIFKINLILLFIIFFFIPILALITIIILIVTNDSLSIEKRNK